MLLKVILGIFFHVNKFCFVIHVLIFLQVMLDQQGLSKGSGFVAFSTPEEASRAVSF
jgi:RNA recognition motif-containing protein